MKTPTNSKRERIRGLSRVVLATLVGLLFMVPATVQAGKLRSSLIESSNNLRAVDKQVKTAAEDFSKISSNSWQLMQMTAGGIDETYLYINQKLKAKKGKYSDNLKKTISDFEDKNVKAFLKGIDDGKKQAIKFSKEWKSVDDNLSAALKKLDGSLDDIEGQIAKKKNAWFKSKKYKAKLKTYEKALTELRQKSQQIQKTLKEAQADNPPSPSQIEKNLKIGPKSTLKELEDLAAHSVKQMLKEYSENKKSSEGRQRKFREAGNFSAELKILKDWAEEADEMTK